MLTMSYFSTSSALQTAFGLVSAVGFLLSVLLCAKSRERSESEIYHAEHHAILFMLSWLVVVSCVVAIEPERNIWPDISTILSAVMVYGGVLKKIGEVTQETTRRDSIRPHVFMFLTVFYTLATGVSAMASLIIFVPAILVLRPVGIAGGRTVLYSLMPLISVCTMNLDGEYHKNDFYWPAFHGALLYAIYATILQSTWLRQHLEDDDERGPDLERAEGVAPLFEPGAVSEVGHCVICLEDEAQLSKLHTCGHSFCSGCIRQWSYQNPTCPTCRAPF